MGGGFERFFLGGYVFKSGFNTMYSYCNLGQISLSACCLEQMNCRRGVSWDKVIGVGGRQTVGCMGPEWSWECILSIWIYLYQQRCYMSQKLSTCISILLIEMAHLCFSFRLVLALRTCYKCLINWREKKKRKKTPLFLCLFLWFGWAIHYSRDCKTS